MNILKHFRKFILAVLLPLVFLTTAVTGVKAEADGPDYFRVTNVEYWDVLNIRRWPSPRSRIVGVIPPNKGGISNLGRFVRGWCLIEYRRVEGWVNCKFLREDYR